MIRRDRHVGWALPTAIKRWWAVPTLLLFVTTARAHPARIASGIAKIDHSGGVKITLTIDLPAFLLNDTPQRVNDVDMNALLDGPRDALVAALADAQDRLVHSSTLKDGVLESATVPPPEEIAKMTGSARLPMMMDVTVSGHLNRGAKAFSLRLPEVLDSTVLTVVQRGEEPQAFAVDGGDFSPDVPIVANEPDTQIVQDQPKALAEPKRTTTFWRYAIVGIAVALLAMGWLLKRSLQRLFHWRSRSVISA
jgi:hypothetical protein